ncbi:hypothetical protein E1B28_013643 [Marasmius oreades]|uniref:Uncharacterized protein n=1 Tax=Marasmius oreades TaxID=181124 RepID=A0A9P7RR24_9AGAR|nr:uncharacterized protein E1B28_013643 [Marasmius oreades]KAG7087696.1 hypothetical protein E1B28_013643 [Marasmius oreades]
MPDDWGRDSPPDASSGVLLVADSITINASVEKVWSTLLDFKSYKEWNPFVRNQTILDATSQTPLSDQTPTLGAFVLIKPVHIPATFDSSTLWPWQKSSVRATITHIDHENHRIAWRMTGVPTFLLDAERWQTVRRRDDGETEYATYEVFRGWLAYVVRLLVAPGLKKAVRAMAQGLKVKAEAQ